MIYEVVATPDTDGVTVTWRDGSGQPEPTTYRVLRHIGDGEDATDDEWATVATVELDDSDDRRSVDHTVEPDSTTRTLEYAVSVDDSHCGASPICPEAPETCTSVLIPATTTDP